MKIRSFIALELPSSTQDDIIWQTANLRKHYPFPVIRWVKHGNIHLTLKFLGDVTKTDLKLLTNSIACQASGIEPFSISFSNLGIFPNIRKPRIIWIGIKTPTNLAEIQSRIDDLTSSLGIQIEKKPFSPHITLGRFGKNNLMLDSENLIAEMGSTVVNSIATIKITEIKIFKSDLKPDGPEYTAIHNIPLGITNKKRGKI